MEIIAPVYCKEHHRLMGRFVEDEGAFFFQERDAAIMHTLGLLADSQSGDRHGTMSPAVRPKTAEGEAWAACSCCSPRSHRD
jgi:hypothetical protein